MRSGFLFGNSLRSPFFRISITSITQTQDLLINDSPFLYLSIISDLSVCCSDADVFHESCVRLLFVFIVNDLRTNYFSCSHVLLDLVREDLFLVLSEDVADFPIGVECLWLVVLCVYSCSIFVVENVFFKFCLPLFSLYVFDLLPNALDIFLYVKLFHWKDM